jgi:UDP-glucose 4-epimerase
VAIFCQRLLAGEPATINGDGKYIRDYVFVEDVARANFSALTHAEMGPFTALNIGTSQGADVNELEGILRPLCEAIREKQGQPGSLPKPNSREARAGDLRSSLVDAKLAGECLDWRPLTSLSAGLKQTAAWFANASQ